MVSILLCLVVPNWSTTCRYLGMFSIDTMQRLGSRRSANVPSQHKGRTAFTSGRGRGEGLLQNLLLVIRLSGMT